MKLDLRRPAIVLIGAWNPAVFTGGWIAHHLFEVPTGQEITATALVEEGTGATIFYIGRIGIGATNDRVRLFCNSLAVDVREEIEKIAVRVVQTLPHTPMGPYGINFGFIEDAPSAELVDMLQCADKLDAKYEVAMQRFTASIPMDECVLNFSRQRERGTVNFEFNYHFSQLNAETAASKVTGALTKYYEHACRLMSETYDLVCEGELVQDFANVGDGAN